MNKKIHIASIIVALLFGLVAVSCGGDKKSDGQKAEKNASVSKTQEKKEPKIRTLPAVVLLDDASLWTLNEENKMVWAKKSLSVGEVIGCIQSDTGDGTGLGPVEKQKFIRVSNGKEAERDFLPVFYEGEKLWVQDALVALDGEPAVLLGECIVYNEPDILEITEKKLPAMLTVAVHVSFTSPEFSKISAYTDQLGKLSEVYIKKDAFSSSERDLCCIALAKKIKALENDKTEIKEKILAELYEDFELMNPSIAARAACAEYYDLIKLLKTE